MQKNTSYWRSRLDAIQEIIAEEKGGDRTVKNNHSVLLRNGVVPEKLKSRYESALKKHQKAWLEYPKEQALSFSEITRYNTWFQLHPEKVAGKERITTSRHFPISIKGSKEDILSVIIKTIQSKPDNNKRLRIAKAKAEAKLKLLELLNI